MRKGKKKKYVFNILSTNPEYWIWVVYMLIASISFIIGVLNTGVKAFCGGTLYYISMSIIAPLLIDFLIQNIESKKYKIENKFLKRKTIALGVCVASIIIFIILIETWLRDCIWLQIIMLILSMLISLYMFCLNRLYLRYEEYMSLDDKSYEEEIRATAQKLSEQQQNLQSVKNDKGDEIKL